MSDKGLSRIIGREVFGLAVRLTGLWVGYISGFTLVVNMTSGFNQGEMMVTALVGLGAGFALVFFADGLCRMSYGRGEADVIGR